MSISFHWLAIVPVGSLQISQCGDLTTPRLQSSLVRARVAAASAQCLRRCVRQVRQAAVDAVEPPVTPDKVCCRACRATVCRRHRNVAVAQAVVARLMDMYDTRAVLTRAINGPARHQRPGASECGHALFCWRQRLPPYAPSLCAGLLA